MPSGNDAARVFLHPKSIAGDCISVRGDAREFVGSPGPVEETKFPGSETQRKGNKMKILTRVSITFLLLLVASSLPASTTWTNFNSIDLGTGTVTGTMGGITVTYTSSDLNSNTQINNIGTNYWLCGVSYCPVYSAQGITPPNTVDMVSLNGYNVEHTLTFSSPVTNPVMALISLGEPPYYNPNYHTTYYFDQKPTILTSGAGWWVPGFTGSLNYTGTNGVQGIEGNGLVEFHGTYSEISWRGVDANAEYWSGLNVGTTPELNVGTTPEPGTLITLGSGIIGLAGVLRRNINL